MKELASEIYDAVRLGKLVEPFNAASVKAACPSWAERTYFTFLGKHGVFRPGRSRIVPAKFKVARYPNSLKLDFFSLRQQSQS